MKDDASVLGVSDWKAGVPITLVKETVVAASWTRIC